MIAGIISSINAIIEYRSQFKRIKVEDLSKVPYLVTVPIFSERDSPPKGTSKTDIEIWKWHNKVRSDPRSIIPELEAMLSYFNQNVYSGQGLYIPTDEGPNSVIDLMAYLKFS